MARIMGTAGAGTTGTAAKATAPRLDSGYVAAITAKIKSNIAYGGSDVAGNPRAEFKIEQLPTGEIISVRKIKSSGIPAYDLAVEAAIAKSSPLPKKKDGSVEREITAGFNMKDLP
jgi:colicin import membrane protein